MHPIPPDNRILFLKRDCDAFGFLSHFYPSPIELDGESWATVEHYYQAQKSFDPAYRAAIRSAASPSRVKRLAAPLGTPRRFAGQSWFRLSGQEPRPDWHEVKLDIMRKADGAKYRQHPELAERLLATGSAELVEDALREPFWGWGLDGEGGNWAGRVLMEIRAELQAQAGGGALPKGALGPTA